MNFKIIFTEAVFWSILWTVMVSISIRIFPFTIEHDYPDDVRKAANISKPSKKHKRNGIIFAAISFLILFGLLISFAILEYNGKELSFLKIFFHLWIICITWNIVDWLIIDWLLICSLSVKYFLLPGTETCNANKNYIFHFIGFLKGCITMSIISALFTAVSYIILLLLK